MPRRRRVEIVLEVLAARADDIEREAAGAFENGMRVMSLIHRRHEQRRSPRHLRHPRRRHAVAAIAVADGEDVDAGGQGGQRAENIRLWLGHRAFRVSA
jgi:hypothetical protein